MNEEEKKEFEKLKKEVEVLNKYVEMKKRQQITFPLDQPSKTIISNI